MVEAVEHVMQSEAVPDAHDTEGQKEAAIRGGMLPAEPFTF